MIFLLSQGRVVARGIWTVQTMRARLVSAWQSGCIPIRSWFSWYFWDVCCLMGCCLPSSSRRILFTNILCWRHYCILLTWQGRYMGWGCCWHKKIYASWYPHQCNKMQCNFHQGASLQGQYPFKLEKTCKDCIGFVDINVGLHSPHEVVILYPLEVIISNIYHCNAELV